MVLEGNVERRQEVGVELMEEQLRREEGRECVERHLATALLEVLIPIENAPDVGDFLTERLEKVRLHLVDRFGSLRCDEPPDVIATNSLLT